jgi:hypothetical protein
MINTTMNEQPVQKPVESQQQSKPNEVAGFYFMSSIKITDPETGKVLVQQRAD